MIHGMTAYARCEKNDTLGRMICDVRSFNHRYFEINLHLSEHLHIFEMPLRDMIRQNISRGKIDCTVTFQPTGDDTSFVSVNLPLVSELSRIHDTIASTFSTLQDATVADVWNFSGVLQPDETHLSSLKSLLFATCEQTLQELIAKRRLEGEALTPLFLDKLCAIRNALSLARSQYPKALDEKEKQIKARFAELQLSLDPNRLAQEMVLLAQKMDITEEMERIAMHLKAFEETLSKAQSAGKQLDFILQELNREANTLCSKSADTIITHAAIEMKVLIEQMREQAQNVA